MGFQGESFVVSESMAKESKFALSADFWIEQADCAGGGIAGVLEFGFPQFRALLIEPYQIGVGHVDFAADLQNGWRRIPKESLR